MVSIITRRLVAHNASRSAHTARAFVSGAKSRPPRPALVAGTAAVATMAAATAYYCYQQHTPARFDSTSSSTDLDLFKTVWGAVLWPIRAVCRKITRAYDEIVSDFANPSAEVLLPPAAPDAFGNTSRTLVLDVEGTLIFNEYQRGIGWRPIKRPHVDLFLLRMFQAGFEICTFSSGHQGVLDAMLTQLDRHRVITHRLYRDATTYRNGVHIKDLTKLNRDLSKVIVVDDEPESFSLHPHNGITIKKFDGDPHDVALLQLIPVLESIVTDDVTDVREVLRLYPGVDGVQKFLEQRISRNKMLREQHIKLGPESSREGTGGAIKTLASWLGITGGTR